MCAVSGFEKEEAAKTSDIWPAVCPPNDGEEGGKHKGAQCKVANIISADGPAAEGASPHGLTVAEPSRGWESVAPNPKQRPENSCWELQLRALAKPKLGEPNDTSEICVSKPPVTEAGTKHNGGMQSAVKRQKDAVQSLL